MPYRPGEDDGERPRECRHSPLPRELELEHDLRDEGRANEPDHPRGHVEEKVAQRAMQLAAAKLPIKCRFVVREQQL